MPVQSSSLRFSPSAAVISGVKTGVRDHRDLSDPVNVHHTQQPEDSDRSNVLLMYPEQQGPFPLFPAFPAPRLECVNSLICRETLQRSLSMYFSLTTHRCSLLSWIMRTIASADLEKHFWCQQMSQLDGI